MKNKPQGGILRRAWVAAADWVRSFTLRDAELYHAGPLDADTGVLLTPNTALQLDTVWACVRLISETLATLPLSMYERTSAGKTVASMHPLHTVIHNQPNPDSTASVFWEAVVAAMLLRGNAHAEILKAGDRVIGLVFLDPAKLVINRDENGKPRYEYQQDGAARRVIPASRVWKIPGFTLDGKTGVSVIHYGAKVFGAAMAAEKAAASTFRNGMLQTVYYKINQFLSPSQRADFHKNVRGSVERGEAPLLEGGSDVNTIGINPSDAQLLESRAYSVEAICRWFRVPPHMVGHTEKSTSWGTGIEQQSIGFVAYTLEDHLTMWEQAIDRDLIGADDLLYARFNRAALVKGDIKARWEAYVKGLQWGVWSPNEIRALEDQNPRDGGDVYYPPPNMSAATEAAGGDPVTPGSDDEATTERTSR